MPHSYTEDQLVDQPTIGLFAEFGWTTVSALERLNPALPPEAITAAELDALLPALLGRGIKSEL